MSATLCTTPHHSRLCRNLLPTHSRPLLWPAWQSFNAESKLPRLLRPVP